MNSNWRLGLGFSLITAVMWGVLPLGLKLVLAVLDPVTITWYRFSLSAGIALLWYGFRRTGELRALLLSRPHSLCVALVLGLLGNYLLYIWGLNAITPGAAQILIQIAPLMLLVGSVVIFRERFTAWQWLGVLSLATGLLLFFHQRLGSSVFTSDDYLLGIALLVAAALSWSVYGLAQRQLLLSHHARDILLLICLAGTVLLWPVARPTEALGLDAIELALLLFCGVNTIVAYGSFGLAMSYWEASRVSAVITLTPLLTLLFSYTLNQWRPGVVSTEPLDSLSYLGACLVVGGAAAVALQKAGAPD